MRYQDFKLVEAPGDEVPAKKMANVNVGSDTYDDKEVKDLQQQVDHPIVVMMQVLLGHLQQYVYY